MTDILDALLGQNAAARAELLDAIDALPGERRLEGWYGPGQWSVKDILAHIARWEEAWARGLVAIVNGDRPTIEGYEPNPDDPDAADDAYNAASVAMVRDEPWEKLMGRLRVTREHHDEAVRALRALDPERYAEGRTAYRFADRAAHDREHLPAILEWRREQSL